MMDSLYCSANDGERQPLKAIRAYLKYPARFEHGRETLVASIPKRPRDGDGTSVKVYETRMPARFYSLRAAPRKAYNFESKKYDGDIELGYEISTGSGDAMGELISSLALAISEGMISVKNIKGRK